MKKLSTLLVALMILTSINVQAQINQPTDFAEEGTILFNPQLLNLGFSSLSLKMAGSEENNDLNQLGLTVSGGYAIKDNLFILGQLGAKSLKFDETNFSFITLGGGARYYLPGNFYAEAGLLLNYGKIKGTGDLDLGDLSSDLSTTMIELYVEAGYSYFILPSVALAPSISYGSKIVGGKLENYDGELTYSRFGINLGVSVFF